MECADHFIARTSVPVLGPTLITELISAGVPAQFRVVDGGQRRCFLVEKRFLKHLRSGGILDKNRHVCSLSHSVSCDP